MPSLSETSVEIWAGVECSINRVKDEYFDQLQYSQHWQRETDVELFANLGIKKIRYPLLWEHHQPDINKSVNWTITDDRLEALRKRNIEIIAGLVHHGSGPSYVQMSDNSFAEGLAAYAYAIASRYPWIEYYTPVNEPLTTARFCGLYGLWYPHEKNDASFCRILINECRAIVLSMFAVRSINPEAKLILTEDLAKIHSTPLLNYQAAFENERRWLSYDLLCGKVNSRHALWQYLLDNGISQDELNYFLTNRCPPAIIGVNYYLTSERFLDENINDYPHHTHGGNQLHTYADVEAVRVGSLRPDGLYNLLSAVWDRYGIPIAITEVHLHCSREEQMRWLNAAWETANKLNTMGVTVVAITAWSLLGSFGWDQLLTSSHKNYEPGVFDLTGGYPRPTVLSEMIKAYAQQKQFFHPALAGSGWWERCERVSYGKDHFYKPAFPDGPLIAVCGAFTAELQEICHRRSLNSVAVTNADFSFSQNEAVLPVWAWIRVTDRIEIKTSGYPDLVIKFIRSEIYETLNTALDLLIDGETGNWEISERGKTYLQGEEDISQTYSGQEILSAQI